MTIEDVAEEILHRLYGSNRLERLCAGGDDELFEEMLADTLYVIDWRRSADVTYLRVVDWADFAGGWGRRSNCAYEYVINARKLRREIQTRRKIN